MAMITHEQWMEVVLQSLGLRSGASPTDFDGASYSMNMGGTFGPADPPPEGWEERLTATCSLIKGFAGSGDRYLMVAKPSAGRSFEYPDCFPKCSSKPSSALATVQIGEATVEDLCNWVVANIPSFGGTGLEEPATGAFTVRVINVGMTTESAEVVFVPAFQPGYCVPGSATIPFGKSSQSLVASEWGAQLGVRIGLGAPNTVADEIQITSMDMIHFAVTHTKCGWPCQLKVSKTYNSWVDVQIFAMGEAAVEDVSAPSADDPAESGR